MKEFLLLLFFSKVICVTPIPIDLEGQVELRPPEAIQAITSGAAIEIEVTHLVGETEGIKQREEIIRKLVPAGAVQAELQSAQHKPVVLLYKGNYAWANDRAWLILSSQSEIPTDAEFELIVLRSEVRLPGVSVRWRNHRK